MRLRHLAFATLLSGLTLASGSAFAEVWATRNNWSSGWEAEYSQWVRSEWSVDIFLQPTLNGEPNPFKGLRADCADTVYSMRAIFAYLHGLPFAMKDPSGGGGVISNRMSRFDGLPEPQKARKFIALIFGVGSTKSLPSDTYPVSISTSTIRPGGLILTTSKNHHSWTIQDILSIGVPHLVFNSTVGATSGSRLQQRTSWPNPAWVFEGDKTPKGHAGIRAFRPLHTIGIPVWEVPGYSEEQYRISNEKYNSVLKANLASHRESDEGHMRRLMSNVCEAFKGRVAAVKEALDFQKMTGGRCMSAGEYDTYSTPSRDKRTFDDIMSLREGFQNIVVKNGGNELDGKTYRQLMKIFPMIQKSSKVENENMPYMGEADAYCVQEYVPGRAMDVAEFKRRTMVGLSSTNPNETAEVRWGDKRGPSSRGNSCPKY